MPDTRDSLLRHVRLMATIAASAGVLLATAGTARAGDDGAEGGASASATVSLSGAGANASAHDEAPSDEPAEKVNKHPANYEFSFVSVGAYQTWSIAGNMLY